MDFFFWIVALWIMAGFIAAVLFGLLSDSGQHDACTISAA